MPLTKLLVKVSFIAKVDTVHAVHTGLRDRHTDGFALFLKASFIVEVRTVQAVNAGFLETDTQMGLPFY